MSQENAATRKQTVAIAPCLMDAFFLVAGERIRSKPINRSEPRWDVKIRVKSLKL
jgi:hypothetical protein